MYEQETVFDRSLNKKNQKKKKKNETVLFTLGEPCRITRKM